MQDSKKQLRLNFHGRIIEQLGIQMYQSPVAAVAELISNAWDADAEKVCVKLPPDLAEGAEVTIRDDGLGMTFEDCQNHYLNVGWCRRGDNPRELSPEKRRPVLGRKGIGKFAGFGIAEVIAVDTVSKTTGERTSFEMDMRRLRSGEYVETEGGDVELVDYDGPNPARIPSHGTTIRLKGLKLHRKPRTDDFVRSMARRFLLRQRTSDFSVFIDGVALPDDWDLEQLEYLFPRDYRSEEKPAGLAVDSDWGIERIGNGQEIRWRIGFYKDPIDDEELRGVSVFAQSKLAQRPFFFNISGGLGGQAGQEYMSGQVQADYVDLLDEDIIAPERQRVNWEHEATIPLEEWGQDRVKKLLRIWRDRRGEDRRKKIQEKVGWFSARLDRLGRTEKRTMVKALNKVASIPILTEDQFVSIGGAMLQAWEKGRLKELINELANRDDITADSLLSILAEAEVLIALNLAEMVRTKIETIHGLRKLVLAGELENAVRDYIAEKPYLLNPKWETFKKEVTVRKILDDSARESHLVEEDDPDGYENKRIDLALRSNDHLLVVEFVRPGKIVDYDHLMRCQGYVTLVRSKTRAQTALGIQRVTGLIVADRLEDNALVRETLPNLTKIDIYAYDWNSLLLEAESEWGDFLDVIGQRAPNDERLRSIQEVGEANA